MAEVIGPDETTKALGEESTYSIKNTKTGQTYHYSKYPITKNTLKYKKIKAAGGDHKHATIHKDGKPVKEAYSDIIKKEAQRKKNQEQRVKDKKITNKHKFAYSKEEVEQVDEADRSSNYGISQADIYQLYGYSKKFLAGEPVKEVLLIYPRSETFASPLEAFWYSEPSERLWVAPYDLEAERLVLPTDSFLSQSIENAA